MYTLPCCVLSCTLISPTNALLPDSVYNALTMYIFESQIFDYCAHCLLDFWSPNITLNFQTLNFQTLISKLLEYSSFIINSMLPSIKAMFSSRFTSELL